MVNTGDENLVEPITEMILEEETDQSDLPNCLDVNQHQQLIDNQQEFNLLDQSGFNSIVRLKNLFLKTNFHN